MTETSIFFLCSQYGGERTASNVIVCRSRSNTGEARALRKHPDTLNPRLHIGETTLEQINYLLRPRPESCLDVKIIRLVLADFFSSTGLSWIGSGLKIGRAHV